MATFFLDTSALAKHFHAEVGSGIVERILQSDDAQFVISRLTCVELLSVSAGKVRGNHITPADFVLFMGQFKAEINANKYAVVRLLNRHFDAAQRLIKAHGLSHRLRALDAIQLAVALEVHREQPLDGFVCADQVLCEVAKLEGLAVINPENPSTP